MLRCLIRSRSILLVNHLELTHLKIHMELVWLKKYKS